ncbi:sugar phosphate nucleotidyltransferase [Patescibacteria group bacterium]|nr:sugar phosphate nucleotidyltransferase [Patescibacteria group bacterium]
MKHEIVAVVCAGGSGSRFWPITENKILFPFMGKPFFSYTVRDVLPKGVTRAVIITNTVNHDVLDALRLPVPHVTVVQERPLGMADAILSAESQIGGASLLVVIADDVTDPSLYAKVLKRGGGLAKGGVLPGLKTGQYLPIGYFEIVNDRIRAIREKPGAGNEPSPYADITGHFIIHGDAFLRKLRSTTSDRDDVYERALTSLMSEENFSMEPYKGPFASLKYPWQILDVMEILLTRLSSHRGNHTEINKSARYPVPVWIGDNVRILENVKIVGPAYIGDNAIVGTNTMIRASHIGEGTVTGFSSDITRSYVGKNCWFHNNYVGDSVLEENISMGSGTVLANLRLDEEEIVSAVKQERIPTGRNKLGAIIGKNVRIGVNASTMPGVKIGGNSFIGAGSLVDRDVPDGSFVRTIVETRVSANRKHVGEDRDAFRRKL